MYQPRPQVGSPNIKAGDLDGNGPFKLNTQAESRPHRHLFVQGHLGVRKSSRIKKKKNDISVLSVPFLITIKLRSSVILLRQNLRVKSDGGSSLYDHRERLNRDLVQGGWFGTSLWSADVLNKFHVVYYTNVSPQKPYSTSVGGAAYNKKRFVNRHIVDFNINVQSEPEELSCSGLPPKVS